MTSQEKENIALFRYSIISPLISGIATSASKMEYFVSASEKEYTLPDGEKARYSIKTIERWFYTYKKYGFDALKPVGRSDTGTQRKLDSDSEKAIKFYIEKYPRIQATTVYNKLIADGYISHGDISRQTIGRYIKRFKENNDIVTTREYRRYEAEHINDIWCCDTSYSFKLTVNGEKKRTYIIAIIDDASRCVVGIDVFFEDNYINFMSVLKSAVKKFGKPKLLNLDNGAPYKNKQLELLGARLGIVLHHCEPRQATSKAKVERWFRTMKDHFMATYNKTSKTTIEEYRKDLLKYTLDYNNSEHSVTKKAPFTRFFEGEEHPIYLDDEVIEKGFLLELDRKVSIDCVVVINNIQFEVPAKYSKKNIRIRYSADFKTAYVVNPDGTLDEIKLLDKVANSKVRRNKPKFNVEDIND